MPKLNRAQIQAKARDILQQHPDGIRWTALLKAVGDGEPETPHNSIHGAVHNLLSKAPDISKIAKGTYVLSQFLPSFDAGALESQPVPSSEPAPNHLEHLYYASFAEWLKEELEDVNNAMALGGNVLKGKWGTPDVIGVLRPQTSDLIKFDPQIVSAEIKTDPNMPVVAFGQAVAYRLFSHKSYMVMPDTGLSGIPCAGGRLNITPPWPG